MSGKASRRSVVRRVVTFHKSFARFGARFFRLGWLRWGRFERAQLVREARERSPHKRVRDLAHHVFMCRWLAEIKLEDAQHGRALALRRKTNSKQSGQ